MNKRKTQLKPADSPVYNYWSALYKSFYSHLLYVDVGKRWKGLGLMYLLLVIVLLTIPYSIKAITNFSESFRQELLEPLSKIPPLYIQNGKISIDQPSPYLIKDNKDQVVLMIDTSGKITKFTKEYPNLQILITKNQIMYMPPPPITIQGVNTNLDKRKPIIQTLSSTYNGIFEGKRFVQDKSIYNLQLFTQVMILPILITMFYTIAVIMFLVFALLSQFFSNVFFSFPLSFAKASRLLIVSATPMLTLSFILMFFNVHFMGMGMLVSVLMVAYFCFAVLSLKKESQWLARKS